MIIAALHITFAILCVITFSTHAPLIIFLCAIASLLPDIDTPKSLIGAAMPIISNPLNKYFGHRTITHSWLAFLPALAMDYLLKTHYAYTITLASHLLLDMIIGINGIQLLYPIRATFTLTGFKETGNAPRTLLIITLTLLGISLIAPALPSLPRIQQTQTNDPDTQIINELLGPSKTKTPLITKRITLKIEPYDNLIVREGDYLYAGDWITEYHKTNLSGTIRKITLTESQHQLTLELDIE